MKFRQTTSLLWNLLKIHHLLPRVSPSRLPMACHPSSSSLSLLDQQTPSLHQGLFGCLFGFSPALIQLVLKTYWGSKIEALRFKKLLLLVRFTNPLRRNRFCQLNAMLLLLSFGFPPAPAFSVEPRNEPSNPSPPKSPRCSPPSKSLAEIPPTPASPMESKHDVPYFRWPSYNSV